MLPLFEAKLHIERALIAGVPAFFVVLVAIFVERVHGLAVKKKWSMLLGDASYMTYLTHPYIVFGIARLFLKPAEMSARKFSTFVAVGIWPERPSQASRGHSISFNSLFTTST